MRRIAPKTWAAVLRDGLRRTAGVEGSTLVVLPTTRKAVEVALRESDSKHLIVADPAIIHAAIDPPSYLALCSQHEACGQRPPSAYVFSDQIVDPAIATLLVERAGVREFLPATEVLARANHAVAVHVWTRRELVAVTPTPARDPRPVLRAMCTYYDACADLGDDWLMRGRQRRRQVESRVDSAMRRLRLYESVVMQAFATNDLYEEARGMLREIAWRRAELAELRGEVR